MTSLFMVRHFYKVDMNIGTLLVIFRYSTYCLPYGICVRTGTPSLFVWWKWHNWNSHSERKSRVLVGVTADPPPPFIRVYEFNILKGTSSYINQSISYLINCPYFSGVHNSLVVKKKIGISFYKIWVFIEIGSISWNRDLRIWNLIYEHLNK